MAIVKKKGISITLILIIINFLIFMIAITFLYSGNNIVTYLGISPSKILNGQDLWTLVTNMFTHVYSVHLFMNMLSLLFLGGFLERILGRKRFLIFYLLAGVFAGLFFVFAALIFQTDLNVTAVGASGAIFGIAGLLAVITPKLPVYIMFIPIPVPMWLASMLILGFMWVFSLIANLPVGNTAHLGGIIFGIAYGFYLRKKYRRRIYLLNRMLMKQM